MQAMDWAALKRRGSASICEGVVPSEIACTRVIESIHAGVKIAWTATKAARSSRSLRARRISINPKMTAVKTVRAVAMFASVERSTGPICQAALFHTMQISYHTTSAGSPMFELALVLVHLDHVASRYDFSRLVCGFRDEADVANPQISTPARSDWPGNAGPSGQSLPPARSREHSSTLPLHYRLRPSR